MANTSRKTVTVVAVGHPGEWVVRTPDGRAHCGATLREATAAAASSEEARGARFQLPTKVR